LGGGSASQGGISNNAGDSFAPSIATDQIGQPYVAWADSSSGNEEIYLKFWDKSQQKWRELGSSASGGGISNNSGSSIRPSITIHNGSVYVAWEDDSSGKRQIYAKQWDGSSWKGLGPTSGGGASASGNRARTPAIKIFSGTPYIAYRNRDSSSDPFNIKVKRFDKANNKWTGFGGSADGDGISNTNADSRKGTLAQAANGDIYVAWIDEQDGDFDVYVKKWTGSFWSSAVNVSQNDGDSLYSNIISDSNGQLYISWDDLSSGNQEIYVKTLLGGQWQALGGSGSGGGVSKSSGISLQATMATNPANRPHVVWMDDSSGNLEIFVRQWDGSAWQEVDSGSATGGGISKNDSSSERPHIAIDASGVPYVTWTDGTVGSREIYVRVFR
jgi:hypothetical protein